MTIKKDAISTPNLANKASQKKKISDKKINVKESYGYHQAAPYPQPVLWGIKLPNKASFYDKARPSQEIKKEKNPHYTGHRQRLRQRFLDSNGDFLADYEILELILYRSLPRVDVKPLAKKLLIEFGSLFDVFGASYAELVKIKDCGPSTATDIKIIYKLCEKLAFGEAHRKAPVFTNWENLLTHCRIKIANEKKEMFYILFLNKRNALIKSEVHQTGTIDHATVYPREIIRRSLELGATGLVLVHNHPSHNTQPSQADIILTRKIQKAAEEFYITVHDHIIIGNNEYTSFRECGFL